MIWVVHPFLQFRFLSNSERNSDPDLPQTKAESRTHHNKVDRRHQRANGRVAQNASLTSLPREGHSHSEIPVLGTHQGSRHRRTRCTIFVDVPLSRRRHRLMKSWIAYRISSQPHRLTTTGDKETHRQPVIDRILDLHLRIGKRNPNKESPKSVCANSTDINVHGF